MNVTIGGIARTVEITSFDKLGDVKVCMLTTTADGSVGFQQLNQEVIDTIYASFPVDTSSGEIASFEDGADNVPVRELKLNLEPYQNLNGYDSPWVGGAGVNKLPYNSSGTGTITRSGITVAVNNGVFTISGTATAGDGINYPLVQSVDLSPSTNKIAFLNSVADGTLTVAFKRGNTTVHFWTMTPVNRVATGWTDSGNEVIDTISIQWTSSLSVSGSMKVSPMLIALTETNPTAFIPYENICPIYPANGKNLLENTASSLTTNGITFTVNADGTVSAKGTATADAGLQISIDTSVLYGDYYYVGAYGQADATANAYMWDTTTGSRCKQWDGTTNVVNSYDGSLKQVKLVQGHTTRMVLRVMNGKTVDMTFFPMICPKEITDPTYVPYKAIGITRTGKNLLNVNNPNRVFSGGTMVFEGSTLKLSGTVSSNTSQAWPADGFLLRAGTYTFSHDYRGTAVFVIGNWKTSYSVATGTTKTFTLSEDSSVTWGVVVTSGTTYNDLVHAQLEVGSVATSYEPYQGERYYPISDNPIYGGTLEVETGVLTVDRAYKSYDGTGWTMYTSGKFYSATDSLPQSNSGASVANMFISNLYPFRGNGDSNSSAITTDKHFYAQRSYHRVWVYDSSFTTLESFQTELSANNLQVVYPLATPQTYQLTPTQVKTLLGYNNIWTDSGTVEVQYLANIGLYIQKIIGATEDDMVANQNISANKYFFVGEELYYSTSAISAGQTIVVGTNCIKTNLADALNALNS